jgi:hypothetical protein
VNELKELFPPKKEIILGENTIEVKSFSIGDLPTVLELVDKFLKKGSFKNEQEIMKVLMSALKDDLEDVLKIIQASTKIKTEDLKQYSVEALVFIIGHVVKVNADFFSQKVAPMFKTFQGDLDKARPKTGK